MASGGVAVVGVGNRMRGDDAVGPMVIDALAGLEGAALFDAGDAPENYIQPVAKAGPARVLFIDACDFGAVPGEFRLFSRAEVEGLAYGLMSTHTLPLNLTMEMVGQETGAEVCLLGVQPSAIEFAAGLSAAAAAALPRVVEFVRRWARA
jgi:hydrogenase 3 maturation protease